MLALIPHFNFLNKNSFTMHFLIHSFLYLSYCHFFSFFTVSKYILTAAHCADGVFHHEVVIGAHEIRDPANKIIDAYSPTVHPEWDSYNLANDLAILELETEIDFDTEPNVGTNCLANDGDHTGEMALVRDHPYITSA